MGKLNHTLSRFEKTLLVFIAVVVIALGAFMIGQGYVASLSTRFGPSEPLFGEDAKELGVVVILLGTLPLLPLCKTLGQMQLLGTLLGIVIIGVVFITIYL